VCARPQTAIPNIPGQIEGLSAELPGVAGMERGIPIFSQLLPS